MSIEQKTAKENWQAKYDAAIKTHPERKARFSTLSALPVDAL